ncbi:MAG: nickel-dependent hydrogenase large subunit [Thermoguttaceae bacterium]
MSTISLNPVTRIEGHLAVHVETEPADGDSRVRVSKAFCEGEMFRGLEVILEGRDPLDAQQITQRICGVCPISHGIASVRAQEMAYGIKPTANGRMLQGLIQAANYLQSHVLHFYHLAALDFVDVTAVLKYSGNDPTMQSLKEWVQAALDRKDTFPAAPFLPRFEADYVTDHDTNIELLAHYVQALDVRKLCHEMGAVFGARLPHSTALVPGGCTQIPSIDGILSYRSRLQKVLSFVKNVYLPDLLHVAKAFPEYFQIGRGPNNFLAFGVFDLDDDGNKLLRPGALVGGKWQTLQPDQIAEEVGFSRFEQPSALHPSQGQTKPAPGKQQAYSWLKAPRYDGHVMEVGALARLLVNYHDPANDWLKKEVDGVLKPLDLAPDQLPSVLGRHLARGLESLWVAQQAFRWLDQLEVDGPPARDFRLPSNAFGFGLTEAPRGALGHWLAIEDYRIRRYQCVVPTTWNCSPRDDKGRPGAVEQAIEGTLLERPLQPIEVGRIIRSFDPCIACAVH